MNKLNEIFDKLQALDKRFTKRTVLGTLATLLILVVSMIGWLVARNWSTEDRSRANTDAQFINLYFVPDNITLKLNETTFVDLMADATFGNIVAIDSRIILNGTSVVAIESFEFLSGLNQLLPPETGLSKSKDFVKFAVSVVCNINSGSGCQAPTGRFAVARIGIKALSEGQVNLSIDPASVVVASSSLDNVLKDTLESNITVVSLLSEQSPVVSPLPKPSSQPRTKSPAKN